MALYALPPLNYEGVEQVEIVEYHEKLIGIELLAPQPPDPSLGNRLYGAQASLATEPWLAVFPGMFIFWIVLGVNLVGDRLIGKART